MRSRLAERAPPAVGTKTRSALQVSPTARTAARQVVDVTAKSARLAPPTSASRIVTTPGPLFVAVNVCVPLMEPTLTAPKSWLVGLMARAGGAVPTPDIVIVC